MIMLVEEVCDFYNDIKARGENNYSAEVLAFAFLLGLPPAECTTMYVETNWDRKMVRLYNDVVDLITKMKR